MDRSENIEQLAGALARAQGKFKTVKRSGRNPNFNSNYATLDDVIAAVRKPLSSEAIAYTQLVGYSDSGYTLTTMLIHESGQFLSTTLPVVIQDALVSRAGKKVRTDLQELGNAITYLKRYMLTSILGVNMEIDADGNTGGNQRNGKQQDPPPQSAQAKAAQEEKARIEAARKATKDNWVDRAKALGLLSEPPASDEWAALISLMGETYKAVSTTTDGFDKLLKDGMALIEAATPKSEPETVEELEHTANLSAPHDLD